MPYRAVIYTMVTVGLAMLAIGMWVSAVGPLLEHPTPVATSAATSPAKGLYVLFKGTLVLSFALVCTLLVVGFVASVREWAKKRTEVREKRRTAYVDAWKLAGERLEVEEDDDEEDEDDEGEEER